MASVLPYVVRTTPPDARFLSRDECAALAKRIAGFAVGGGYTQTVVESSWTGNVRWTRNQISTCGDVRNTDLLIQREIHGAASDVRVNQIDPVALEAAVRRAERTLQMNAETQSSASDHEYTEQHLKPTIWSDATYTLGAEARAEMVSKLVQAAQRAGLLAAGYIQISGRGRAIMSSKGRAMYYPYTEAQYSVTVRDPKGTGSGWAGLSHYDWAKIDAQAITQRAVDKCLASRNPVALEPGRYTAVLEPQAVCDLCVSLFSGIGGLDREAAENPVPPPPTPFWKAPRQSKLGEVVMDDRLVVGMDPMAPDLGFVPFQHTWKGLDVYYAAEWVRQGVLTSLAYDRPYGVEILGKNTGLPSPGSFVMRALTPPTPIEEMIATTKRGILVTRFDQAGGGGEVWMGTGRTRDGMWLIENGKISKPIKNFKFEDSGYLILQKTRLEQIGAPERVFHPMYPVMVPPLKVRDFNFTQMVDAV